MPKVQLLGEAPAPGVNQNYTTQKTIYGWVMKPYKPPSKWRHLVSLRHWEQWTLKPIVQINREWIRWAGMYWKYTLPQSKRNAWAAAAEQATWEAYHGHPAYRGGFELFITAQRLRNYIAFSPYQPDARVKKIYFDTIPDPWAPPPAPSILSQTNFPNGEWFAQLGNCPDIHVWVIAAIVSQRRAARGPKRPKSYITAFSNTITLEPDICYVSVYLYYPWAPNYDGPVTRVTLGLRWYNFLTLQFGNITWVAL